MPAPCKLRAVAPVPRGASSEACAESACASRHSGAAPLTLTLQDALARARANVPQLLSANITAQLAHEDRVQAQGGAAARR